MNWLRRNAPGVLVCLCVCLPAWFLGLLFPIVGGPVFAILIGMLVGFLWKTDRSRFQPGITFTSKKVLQYAVIFLGFGLNLADVAQVGFSSLPIICSTILTALIVAFAISRVFKIPGRIATLIGVGSSICGGSAIAATAPVIKASDKEVAQAISVIFLFNVVAALIFPALGNALGLSNEGFGLFAGTAVNDTSSVTAAAAAWDGMHENSNALDYATIVKLTRTLAIIPITLILSIWVARKEAKILASVEQEAAEGSLSQGTFKQLSVSVKEGDYKSGFSLRRAFPMFILWFLAASLITTIALALGAPEEVFAPLKTFAKFLIVAAMAAIGINTDIVGLIKTGGKPLALGFICWVAIAIVSLAAQSVLGLW
jgi:uncharacterized integral membrane protein (TIGR00698 family)